MNNFSILHTIPTNMDKNYLELTRKVHLILHVGRLMMENSADTSRIVRSMRRTAAYGNFWQSITNSCYIYYFNGKCKCW